MRRHHLLLFLMFGCFIGSVLSDPETSTSSAPGLDDCMSTYQEAFINETNNNATLFEKFMDNNNFAIMLTNNMNSLQISEDLAKKFVDQAIVKHVVENVIEQLFGDETTAEMVGNKTLGERKEEIIMQLLRDSTAKTAFEEQIFGGSNDNVIEKVIKDRVLVKDLLNEIDAKVMAAAVSERINVIFQIGKDDAQVKSFMDDETFRPAVIKNILKYHRDALNDELKKADASDEQEIEMEKEDSKAALHRLLHKNKNYALLLKLLLLSPMIFAWTASLICIASMCGVCYPFGLSESTKKSDEKKGRKKSTEKKGKKKGGNDE